MNSSQLIGSRFTMGALDAVATSMSFYYEHTGTPDNYVRGAIYTVDGDLPGQLVGQTDIHAINVSDGWMQVDFLRQPTLEAGVEYFLFVWIGYTATGDHFVVYDVPGGNQGYTRSMGGATYPLEFTQTITGGSARTYLFSIYTTYAKILGTFTNDLKATFEVGQSSADLKAVFRLTQEDLKAEFLLRQLTNDLPAEFSVTNDSAADLKGVFEVSHDSVAEIASEFIVRHRAVLPLFAKLVIRRTDEDLFAVFTVRQIATYDIPAETVIRHTATKELAAEFIVRHTGVAQEIEAELIVRHTGTYDLYSVFWVGGSEDLKATFYIPTRRNQDAYYKIIDDGIAWWINYLDVQGKGFIGYPTFENDDQKVFSGVNSLKVTSDEVNKGYKEITFGWLYEPVLLNPINEQPCVPLGKSFDRLIRESWDWGGKYFYDDLILGDTTIRFNYDTDFGISGWSLADVNYGNETWLRISQYEGYYSGEIPSQYHYNDETAMLTLDLPDIDDLPDLSRLAWARMELYRYQGRTGDKINTRRIPECDEIQRRTIRWNPNSIIGGCNPRTDYGGVPYSSTGRYAIDTWTPGTVQWQWTGRWNINIGGRQYLGNASFREDPEEGGVSWDDNVYENFPFTDLFKGWLEGTWANHGIMLEMDRWIGADQWMNLTGGSGDGPRFHSLENTNKPRYRLQFWPEGKQNDWEFKNSRVWEINEDDPYLGSGSLRLVDWSKQDYRSQSSAPSYFKYLTTKSLKEGYVDLIFRFNNEERTQVRNQFAHEAYSNVETTPKENLVNIQFRYQDDNNHYQVQFNTGQTNTKIQSVVSGSATNLNTFDGRFKVGVWYHVKVFWTINDDGEFKVCCYKYDDEQEVWRFLGGALDGNNYWPDGGDVRFETWDSDFDETEVWEGR